MSTDQKSNKQNLTKKKKKKPQNKPNEKTLTNPLFLSPPILQLYTSKLHLGARN